MADVPITIYANQYDSSDTDITLYEVALFEQKYYYVPSQEQMVARLDYRKTLPLPQEDIKD
jgi:hypothetical protein